MKTVHNASIMTLLREWWHPINPLTEILDLIPFGDTILDLELCDKFRKLIKKGNPKLSVDDAMVYILMTSLKEEGLIDIVELGYPSAFGKVIFIKRAIGANNG